jgi:uncharacterized protein
MKEHNKITKLKEKIKALERVLVSFSGGIDSTFLLKICVDVLGAENVCAVTAESEIYDDEELEDAKHIVQMLGVAHHTIKTDILYDKKFSDNTIQRCYVCKSRLFRYLRKIADGKKIDNIVDGSIDDDKQDFRPGMTAARELGVISPLLETGLTKNEIRYLLEQMGFFNYNKPSQSCFASRIPYGDKITVNKITMVRNAERFLKKIGFRTVRVRHHDQLARIEIDKKEIKRLINKDLRDSIVSVFKEIGYRWICVDLEGYETGSLNRGLNEEK